MKLLLKGGKKISINNEKVDLDLLTKESPDFFKKANKRNEYFTVTAISENIAIMENADGILQCSVNGIAQKFSEGGISVGSIVKAKR